jgi:hypothetical protein
MMYSSFLKVWMSLLPFGIHSLLHLEHRVLSLICRHHRLYKEFILCILWAIFGIGFAIRLITEEFETGSYARTKYHSSSITTVVVDISY